MHTPSANAKADDIAADCDRTDSDRPLADNGMYIDTFVYKCLFV